METTRRGYNLSVQLDGNDLHVTARRPGTHEPNWPDYGWMRASLRPSWWQRRGLSSVRTVSGFGRDRLGSANKESFSARGRRDIDIAEHIDAMIDIMDAARKKKTVRVNDTNERIKSAMAEPHVRHDVKITD